MQVNMHLLLHQRNHYPLQYEEMRAAHKDANYKRRTQSENKLTIKTGVREAVVPKA